MSPEDFIEERQRERDENLLEVMATEAGREVLWRIIDEYGHLQGQPPALDAQTLSVHAGRRAVAVALDRECRRVDPANYVHMLTEAMSRRQEEQRLAQQTDDEDE